MGNNPTVGGRVQILRNYYDALEAKQIDKLLPQKEIDAILNPPPPPPNPDLLRLEADILKEKHDYEIRREEMELDRLKIESQVELAKAQAIKAIADAESKEAGRQFEEYKFSVDKLSERVDQQISIWEEKNRAREAAASASAEGNGAGDDAGATGGMEATGLDEGGIPVPAPDTRGLEGNAGGGVVPVPGLGGGDGASDGSAGGGGFGVGPLARTPIPGA
jgi:hypothetical protein